MSKMITDLFERQSLGYQARGASVTQAVRSAMSALHIKRLQFG